MDQSQQQTKHQLLEQLQTGLCSRPKINSNKFKQQLQKHGDLSNGNDQQRTTLNPEDANVASKQKTQQHNREVSETFKQKNPILSTKYTIIRKTSHGVFSNRSSSVETKTATKEGNKINETNKRLPSLTVRRAVYAPNYYRKVNTVTTKDEQPYHLNRSSDLPTLNTRRKVQVVVGNVGVSSMKMQHNYRYSLVYKKPNT